MSGEIGGQVVELQHGARGADATTHEGSVQFDSGQVDRVAEGVASLSLFDRHADTEVAAFGTVGTLAELARECPFPLEQADPERVHDWTVRILDKSGYELTEDERVYRPTGDSTEKQPAELEKKN